MRGKGKRKLKFVKTKKTEIDDATVNNGPFEDTLVKYDTVSNAVCHEDPTHAELEDFVTEHFEYLNGVHHDDPTYAELEEFAKEHLGYLNEVYHGDYSFDI